MQKYISQSIKLRIRQTLVNRLTKNRGFENVLNLDIIADAESAEDNHEDSFIL
jgi:hypothetical protein